MACACCGTPGCGIGCCSQLCRRGCPTGGLPTSLQATLEFPATGLCCCPFPSGGSITFPMRWTPTGVGTGFFPDTTSPCHSGVSCETGSFQLAPGWLGDTSPIRCEDNEATSCVPAQTPPLRLWEYPLFFGSFALAICIGAGTPSFYLSGAFGPLTPLGLSAFNPNPICPDVTGPNDGLNIDPCGAGSAPNINPESATEMLCRNWRTTCQQPDAPFLESNGYDCNNIYLEWTVTSKCGGAFFDSHKCGLLKVIIETPT